MDQMLYIAMSGAKESLNAVSVRANNLANANTTAFKADFAQARAMQAYGEGLPTRVFAMTETPGQRFTPGAIETTGGTLDVAVNGDGWLTVQDPNGQEAFTRDGGMQLDVNGQLLTRQGMPVVDDGNAPIFIPLPVDDITINARGMIQIRPQGAPANALEDLAQLKLVKPNNADLVRGTDGMFRRGDGEIEPISAEVTLTQGALEGSNVNPVEEMTQMISLQRHFDLQVKLMDTAKQNSEQSDSLLRSS